MQTLTDLLAAGRDHNAIARAAVKCFTRNGELPAALPAAVRNDDYVTDAVDAFDGSVEAEDALWSALYYALGDVF